jgi:hypothetical protein
MRTKLGQSIRFFGTACFWLFGLVGFLISLSIVDAAAGFWGFVIAFVVAPITFAAAPWYALVAHSNPFPLAINYGGSLVSGLLIWTGTKIVRDDGVRQAQPTKMSAMGVNE